MSLFGDLFGNKSGSTPASKGGDGAGLFSSASAFKRKEDDDLLGRMSIPKRDPRELPVVAADYKAPKTKAGSDSDDEEAPAQIQQAPGKKQQQQQTVPAKEKGKGTETAKPSSDKALKKAAKEAKGEEKKKGDDKKEEGGEKKEKKKDKSEKKDKKRKRDDEEEKQSNAAAAAAAPSSVEDKSKSKSKPKDTAAAPAPAEKPSKKQKKESAPATAQRAEQGEGGDGEAAERPVSGEEAAKSAAAAPRKTPLKVEPMTEADIQALQEQKAKEDAERLSRTIFIGNVPIKTKKKALKKVFGRFGEVEAVRLRSIPLDNDSKLPTEAKIKTQVTSKERSSQHAYLVFKSVDSVEKSLVMNMKEFDRHHLIVDRAANKRDPKHPGAGDTGAEYNPSRSVFLGNLPWDVEEEEIIQFFSRPEVVTENPELKDALVAVRIVRDPASKIGKGFGFALFKFKAAARAALSMDEQEIKKRKIRVSRCQVVPESVKQKGKGSSGGRKTSGGPRGPGGAAAGGGGGSSQPADYQGTRVKKDSRKKGAVKGRAPSKGGLTPKVQDGGVKKGGAGGKRPSVAARKDAAKKGRPGPSNGPAGKRPSK